MVQFKDNPIIALNLVNQLVRLFSKVKTSLKLYSGEAHWLIFDNPWIGRILREINSRGVSIQIITGPVICKDGVESTPQIVDLFNEKVIKLYIRPTRGTVQHFCLYDDETLRLQEPHDPLEALDVRHRPGEFSRKDAKSLVEDYINVFNQFATSEYLLNKDFNNCLFLSPNELQKIVKYATKKGLPYNNLQIGDLKKLLDELKTWSKEETKLFEEKSKRWEQSAPASSVLS